MVQKTIITTKIKGVQIAKVGVGETLHERVTCAILIGLSSYLSLSFIPFLPQSLTILFSILFLLITLRDTTVAIFSSFFIVNLALGYQFGALIGNWLGTYFIFAYIPLVIFLTGRSIKVEGAIGASLGLLASAIMLTPFYFIAIPLIIFFITTYRKIGRINPIITFLAYYIPIQITATATTLPKLTGLPILYSYANPNFYPSVEVLTFTNIIGPIVNSGRALKGDPEAFTYWVVQYFTGNFGIIAFISIILLSISSCLIFENWILSLEKKGFELKRLNRVTHFISNLIGCIVFAMPIVILSNALGYVTDLQGIIIPYLAISSLGSGFANLIKLQMDKRQLMLKLKMEIEERAEKVLKRIEDFQAQIDKIRAIFKNIMIEDISASLSETINQLNLTLTTLNVMKMIDLQERLNKIKEYEQSIDFMFNHLIKRIQDHYVKDLTRFRDTFIKASSLNVKQPIEIPIIDQKSILEWDLEKIIEAQKKLYEDAKINLQNLSKTCNEVYETIRQNIDQDFTLPTVEIARQFIEQGDLEKGAEIAIEALESINEKFGKKVGKFAQLMRNWLISLKELLKVYVEPKVMVYPMVNLEAEMKLLNEVDVIINEIVDKPSIVEIINLAITQKKIVKFTIELMKIIDNTLREIENEINKRVPKGFDWGRDDQIHNLVESIVHEIEISSIKLNEISFDLLNKAYKILNTEMILLDRYLLEFEIILNYPNVDSLIFVKLKSKGVVHANELPFNFPEHYMKLYSAFHKDVVFDGIGKSLILQNIEKRKESI